MFRGKLILAYHQTADRFYPGITNIRPGRFFQILDALQEAGIVFRTDETDQGRGETREAIITFDDGLADQYPILLKLIDSGINPVLFVPTGFIGKCNSWEYLSRTFPARHMSAEQIRDLSDRGALIGSHGVSHRALTTLPEEVFRRELVESREILEEITGEVNDLLSFPFGRTSHLINTAAREYGYRYGFVLGDAAVPGQDEDFVVSRLPIYGNEDYYSLRAKISGLSWLERFKSRLTNDLAAGAIIISPKLK